MMIYLFVSICSTWLECSEKMGRLLGRDGTAEAYLNYSANDVCIPKRFRFRDSSFETLPVKFGMTSLLVSNFFRTVPRPRRICGQKVCITVRSMIWSLVVTRHNTFPPKTLPPQHERHQLFMIKTQIHMGTTSP